MPTTQPRRRVARSASLIQVHASRSRPPSWRATYDAALIGRMKAIHEMSDGTYRAPRIKAELAALNRPDLTGRIFARIAEVKPRRLFVICDGPRPARVGEQELCRQVRSTLTSPPRNCELMANFSDTN